MIGPRNLLFSVFFILAAVSFSPAANYYVTQSGSGGTCTSAPIGAPMSAATFNGCSSGPTGGDTVYFTGTITTTISPSRTGTSSLQLTLDFTGATINGIKLSGDSYLTLNGGTISSSSSGADGSDMIYCAGSTTNITINGFSYIGPSGGTNNFLGVSAGCSNFTVSNNHVDNIAYGFVTLTGGLVTNYDFANNYVRSSTNITTQTDLFHWADATNIIIEGNQLINQSPGSQSNSRHNDVIQTYKSGAGGAVNPSNWTIRYNWIEEAVTDCADTDGSNSYTMMENLIGTNYVYGNVFYTTMTCNFGNGLTLKADVSSAAWYVYNNTFATINTGDPPVVWFQSGNGAHAYFENNAAEMTSNSGGTLLEAASQNWLLTADYNYFSNISNCPNGDGSTSWVGTHGTCSPTLPMFTDFAAVTSGGNFAGTSTLQNQGDSTIGSQFNQGICPGATWPNPSLCQRLSGKWDIGAYQGGSSGTSPNPPTGLAALVQ